VPWAVFGGVDYLSSIMAAEPVVEVIGQTHIKVLGSKVAGKM
jgi:hypothetical protein